MGKHGCENITRRNRVKRVRKKVFGTTERPRLRVFKSAKNIYAQIIDDTVGSTIVSMSTLSKIFNKMDIASGKVAESFRCGLLIAKLAKDKGISKVVFDRGGYLYHGRVKALSEGAREGGLVF